jgi:LemA protein
MDILTLVLSGIVVLAIIVVLLVIVAAIPIYNRLVAMKNGIEGTFNQINVAMKKRFDMLYELVNSAKSYMKFEKSTFEQITKYRSMRFSTPEQAQKADAFAKSVLGAINVAVENYPALKGNETVIELQHAIKDIEDEIARVRYLYNDQVQKFNITVEQFPTNIYAMVLGFGKRQYLEFEAEIKGRVDTTVFE